MIVGTTCKTRPVELITRVVQSDDGFIFFCLSIENTHDNGEYSCELGIHVQRSLALVGLVMGTDQVPPHTRSLTLDRNICDGSDLLISIPPTKPVPTQSTKYVGILLESLEPA